MNHEQFHVSSFWLWLNFLPKHLMVFFKLELRNDFFVRPEKKQQPINFYHHEKIQFIGEKSLFEVGIAFAKQFSVVVLGGEPRWRQQQVGELAAALTVVKQGGAHRARLSGLAEVRTAHEKGDGGRLRSDGRGACVQSKKIMPVLPYLKLLVVTARNAWFNFRGWKKRP